MCAIMVTKYFIYYQTFSEVLQKVCKKKEFIYMSMWVATTQLTMIISSKYGNKR